MKLWNSSASNDRGGGVQSRRVVRASPAVDGTGRVVVVVVVVIAAVGRVFGSGCCSTRSFRWRWRTNILLFFS